MTENTTNVAVATPENEIVHDNLTAETSSPEAPAKTPKPAKTGKDKKSTTSTSGVKPDTTGDKKTGKDKKSKTSNKGKKPETPVETKKKSGAVILTVKETFLSLNAVRKDTAGKGGTYNVLPEKEKGKRAKKNDFPRPDVVRTREGTIIDHILKALASKPGQPLKMKEIKALVDEATGDPEIFGRSQYDPCNGLWRRGLIGKTEDNRFFLLPAGAHEKKPS